MSHLEMDKALVIYRRLAKEWAATRERMAFLPKPKGRERLMIMIAVPYSEVSGHHCPIRAYR